jgi:hypothetical protein
MSETELKKIANRKAKEISRSCDLEAPAKALLDGDPGATTYLARLQDEELFPDAVRFLAAALPKREAVWWACLCARTAPGDTPVPEATRAIEGAEAWVYKPTEPHRRATESLAESATYEEPAAWAAMAAFWSGGSTAPEGQPVVPPGDELTGKAAAGAILLAAAKGDAAKMTECYRDFLAKGLDIASGGDGRSASV